MNKLGIIFGLSFLTVFNFYILSITAILSISCVLFAIHFIAVLVLSHLRPHIITVDVCLMCKRAVLFSDLHTGWPACGMLMHHVWGADLNVEQLRELCSITDYYCLLWRHQRCKCDSQLLDLTKWFYIYLCIWQMLLSKASYIALRGVIYQFMHSLRIKHLSLALLA